jgi:hypothetical protein
MTTVMYSVDDNFRNRHVDLGKFGFKPLGRNEATGILWKIRDKTKYEISAGILCYDIVKDGRRVYGTKRTPAGEPNPAYFIPDFSDEFANSLAKVMSRKGLVLHGEGVYSTMFRDKELKRKYENTPTTHFIGPEDAIIQELVVLFSESDARGAVITDLKDIIEWREPEATQLFHKSD